jgi:hypothetical protein
LGKLRVLSGRQVSTILASYRFLNNTNEFFEDIIKFQEASKRKRVAFPARNVKFEKKGFLNSQYSGLQLRRHSIAVSFIREINN